MGAMDNPKPDDVPQSRWAQRLMAAHSNSVENLVVFAPLVLAWYRAGPGFDGRLIGTAAAVIGAVAVVGALAYVTKYPIDYLYLPILLWAGFRAKAGDTLKVAFDPAAIHLFDPASGARIETGTLHHG